VVKNPAYATAVGLVKYGAARVRAAAAEKKAQTIKPPVRSRGGFFTKWISDAF
jgi:hypothetical protein